jgi:predicted metalloendopeptidase
MVSGNLTPPLAQGFTGDQRFFIIFGQIWRNKAREEMARQWTSRMAMLSMNIARTR